MQSLRSLARFRRALGRIAVAFLWVGVSMQQSAFAQTLNYTISYNAVSRSATVASSQYGTWQAFPSGPWGVLHLVSTGPGTTQPPNTSRHVIEFEFMAQNYFGSGGGHFGLFARGDMYTPNPINPDYPYRGHGVILGDVSGYPNFQHPYGYACTRTAGNSRVAIEVAGAVAGSPLPNCVFGQQTDNGYSLVNNAWYRLRLVSEFVGYGYRTSYSLYHPSMVGWLEYARREVTYQYPQLPTPLGGWFLAETFNRSNNWTLYVRNLNARWE